MRKLILLLVIYCIAYSIYKYGSKSEPYSCKDTDNIGIKVGNNSWRGCILSKLEGQFIVVGGKLKDDVLSNGFLPLIPMTEVPGLEKRHQNFLKCEGSGPFIEPNLLINASYVLGNDGPREVLNRIYKLILEKDYRPVVKVTADRLVPNLLSVNGELMAVGRNITSQFDFYRLKHLEIVQENYQSVGYESFKGNRFKMDFEINFSQ